MKKLAITVTYKGVETQGNVNDYNEEEEQKIIALVEKASRGEVNYLKIQRGNSGIYYPSKVLEKSIITIREFK